MKVKRSFAISDTVEKWLKKQSSKNGESVSAFLNRILIGLMESK
jgi:hypothetical protein